MNILVTGATGKFGPILIDSLLKEKHSVRALVHNTPINIAGVESVAGSITDRESLVKACDGVDAICHLATVKGNRDSFININLGGLFLLLDIISKKAAPPRFILLSGDNTLPIFDYENAAPMNETHPRLFVDDEYGLSKILEEEMAMQYAKKYNLPITILRSSWIMEDQRSVNLCHPKKGAWKSFLNEELRMRLDSGEDFRIIPYDANNKPLVRHVIDPRDLSRAFNWALTADNISGELFNISGAKTFDYKTLAEYLNSIENKPTYNLILNNVHSFEIDTSKAARHGFKSIYTIYDTIKWALGIK
ncbi:MAG: NAD(P)-dependent oxidoreductase [Fibrobacteres bacterium]|nr:NAD(P)-dependent oxidoreductase [Fibrobacterota bacterium]